MHISYFNNYKINNLLSYLPIFVACGLIGGYNGYQKEFVAIFYFILIVLNFNKFGLIKYSKSLILIFILIAYPLLLNFVNAIFNSELSLFPENNIELIFWLKVILTPALSILLYKIGLYTKINKIEFVVFLSLIGSLALALIGLLFEINIALTFLEGAYESSGRLYLVGLYIFSYISIIYFLKKNIFLSFLYFIPALISQSKIIIITYLIFIIIKMLWSKNKLQATLLLSVIIFILNFSVFQRFDVLYRLGDMYRFGEIMDMNLFWLNNPLNIFFGTGTSQGYRVIESTLLDEVSYGFLLNFERTIHFGYYDLVFRYGIFLTIIYIASLIKLIKDDDNVAIRFFLMLLLASPTLVHGPEALGFFFMIGLLKANKI